MKEKTKKFLLVAGVGFVAYLLLRQSQNAQAAPLVMPPVYPVLPLPTTASATTVTAIPVGNSAPPAPPLDVTTYQA